MQSDNPSPDTPQEIDLSERKEVVERESSAEIELFHSLSQLSTAITVPIRNTFYYLLSKAAEIFRDGEIALFMEGEQVDIDNSLEQMGVAAGDKKRVEVRYVEKEPPQEVELEKEQELIEKETVTQPSEEVRSFPLITSLHYYILHDM